MFFDDLTELLNHFVIDLIGTFPSLVLVQYVFALVTADEIGVIIKRRKLIPFPLDGGNKFHAGKLISLMLFCNMFF
jgi:hypothetical protein